MRHGLFFLLFFFTSLVWGDAPPKVAILPLKPSESTLALKRKGEFFSGFLQGKLSDFPEVEWVERENLGRLLSESQYSSGSPIALGRLSKADLVVHGRIDPIKSEGENESRSYSRTITLNVVDLTNAEILASETTRWPVAEGATGDNEALEPFAAAGRRLLAEAIKKRAASSNARVLAPVFFANLGAGVRLDPWAEQMRADLDAAAADVPGIRLLNFRGASQASDEQQLALLGLTDTDPNAWQKAANGYVWGGFREIAVDKTTAFEEVQVEAELYLCLGDRSPQRFSRSFAVRDFARESKALTREVIAAAAKAPAASELPDVSSAGRQIAEMIFNKLAETMGSDFFLLQQAAGPGEEREVLPRPYSERILKLPYGKEKLAYAQQTLQLACFFDPSNPRWQLIRLLLDNHREAGNANPDEKMAYRAQLVRQLERFTRQPDYDTVFFIDAANQLIRRLVAVNPNLDGWRRPFPKGSPAANSGPDFSLDVGLAAERAKLLSECGSFFPLQVKAMLERDGSFSEVSKRRSIARLWMRECLKSDLPAEARLAFLEVVWPYINSRGRELEMDPSWYDLTREVDRLMTDLQDRSRVQTALQLEPKPRPGARAQSVSGRSHGTTQRPFARLGSTARPVSDLAFDRALLQTATVPGPRFQELAPNLFENASFGSFSSHHHPLSYFTPRLEGFEDQLIIDFEISRIPSSNDDLARGLTPLRYQSATGLIEPMDGALRGTTVSKGGRVVYRSGDKVGWHDLITGESGVFDFEAGLSVANPSTLGLTGAGALYVGGEVRGDRIAGTYDWKGGRWLTPPAPPAAPIADAGKGNWWRPNYAPASSEWLLFPSWSLLYRPESQEWRPVGEDLLKSAGAASTPGNDGFARDRMLEGYQGGIEIDGDFWIWNSECLKQFSPGENRVLWHSFTENLSGIASDGPYLWLIFDQTEARQSGKERGQRTRLVLMERKTHAVIGALEVPHALCASYFGPHDAYFIADRFLRERQQIQARLLRVEKAALYAALKVQPPTREPLRFASEIQAEQKDASAALYRAILSGEAERIRQLLDGGVPANTTFGKDKTPALMVAVWTRNAKTVQALVDHGADLEATAFVNVPLAKLFSHSIGGQKVNKLPATITALSVAAQQSSPAMSELLLKAGANPAGPGSIFSPLAEAVRNQHVAVAALLVAKGAPLAATDPEKALEVRDIAQAIAELEQGDADRRRQRGRALDPGDPVEARRASARKIVPYLGAPDVIEIVIRGNDSEMARGLLSAGDRLQPIDRERLLPLAGGMPDQPAKPDQPTNLGFDDLCRLIADAQRQGDETRAVELIGLLPQDRMGDAVIAQFLWNFVETGKAAAVKALLQKGANWQALSGKQRRGKVSNLLWRALEKKHLEVVYVLLDAGVDPRLGDQRFVSVLEYAAEQFDSPPLLDRLIKAYPDFKTRKIAYGTLGGSSLCGAIRGGHAVNAKFLFAQGVSPNDRDRLGYPPFHSAFVRQDPAMACMLVGAGADLGGRDLAGRTAFDYPSMMGGSLARRAFGLGAQRGWPSRNYKPASEIEEKGLQILSKVMNERPSADEMLAAIEKRDLPTLRELIGRRPTLWNPTWPEATPGLVYAATGTGSKEMVALLLDHGWSPNVGEKGVDRHGSTLSASDYSKPKQIPSAIPVPVSNGRTPLLVAAESGDLAMVTLLLNRGAYAPAKDAASRNAIDLAAIPAIAKLIEEKTRPQFAIPELEESLKNSDGLTSKSAIEALAQIFKKQPAVAKALNPSGVTVLGALSDDWFVGSQVQFVMSAIRRAGIPLDALDENGVSALHRAVLYRESYKVRDLVEMGFNPNSPDARGVSAIDLATTILNERDKKEILQILQETRFKAVSY